MREVRYEWNETEGEYEVASSFHTPNNKTLYQSEDVETDLSFRLQMES